MMFRFFLLLLLCAMFFAMLDSFLIAVSNASLSSAQWLITNILNSISPATWSILMLGLTVGILSHQRFASFEKPDYPRASAMIRTVATLVHPLLVFIGLSVLAATMLALAGYITGYGMHPESKKFSGHTVFEHALTMYWSTTSRTHIAQIGGVGLGIGLSIALTLFIIPTAIRRGLGPKTQATLDKLQAVDQFDPEDFVNLTKGLFIGLNTDKKPFYVPWRKVDETHMQIMGSTGAGKGVSLSLMGMQFSSRGKTVVFFDPKGDSHAKSILMDAAIREFREFIYLDLNQPTPQINPFANSSPEEAADLLIAAFELRAQGTDGDYHKGREEDCCYILADHGIQSLPSIIELAHQDPVVREEENFLRKLRKLQRSNVFMTDEGPDLEKLIQKGSIIYIQCSAGSEAVSMAQKLLLLRVMQIIKGRADKQRSVAVILDEFKYMLSPAALMALGLMRSSNCHCLLAFQAIGDLLDNPSLNEESAKSAVLTNTALKLVFRIPEISYAEELSRMTLTYSRFDEVTSKTPDLSNHQGLGGWREVHEPEISPNLLTNLPMPTDYEDGKTMSCGVLFVGSNPVPLAISPAKHSNSKPEILPAATAQMRFAKAEDLI